MIHVVAQGYIMTVPVNLYRIYYRGPSLFLCNGFPHIRQCLLPSLLIT